VGTDKSRAAAAATREAVRLAQDLAVPLVSSCASWALVRAGASPTTSAASTPRFGRVDGR
jgi:hypothetical protein